MHLTIRAQTNNIILWLANLIGCPDGLLAVIVIPLLFILMLPEIVIFHHYTFIYNWVYHSLCHTKKTIKIYRICCHNSRLKVAQPIHHSNKLSTHFDQIFGIYALVTHGTLSAYVCWQLQGLGLAYMWFGA